MSKILIKWLKKSSKYLLFNKNITKSNELLATCMSHYLKCATANCDRKLSLPINMYSVRQVKTKL